MTWNYRVHRAAGATLDDDPTYSIIEVFYDEAGNIEAWSDAHPPEGDDLNELVDVLLLMYGATTKAILHDCDLPPFATAEAAG